MVVSINSKSVHTKSSSKPSFDFHKQAHGNPLTGEIIQGHRRRGGAKKVRWESGWWREWREGGTRTCRPWSTFQCDSFNKNSELAATWDNRPNLATNTHLTGIQLSSSLLTYCFPRESVSLRVTATCWRPAGPGWVDYRLGLKHNVNNRMSAHWQSHSPFCNQ